MPSKLLIILTAFGWLASAQAQDKAISTATLMGVTRELGGGVVPNASVRILDKGGKVLQTLTSDSNGSFFSSTTPLNAAVLEVDAYGYYPPYRQDVQFTGGSRVTLDIWLLAPTPNSVNVPIVGEVLDEQKRPIPNAQVEVKYYGRFSPPWKTTTDNKGNFGLTVGYVGQMLVKAHADGFEDGWLVFFSSRDMPSKEQALRIVLKRKSR